MNIFPKFNKFQILNKCRICLSESGAFLIFSSYGEDNIDVRAVYETYTGIKVEEEDNMPKKVCNNCLNDLMVTHDFIQKCKRANTVLRNLETELIMKNPKDFTVVIIDDDNSIEYEYDGNDTPCVSVKNNVKYEYSEILKKELRKINYDQNEVVNNKFVMLQPDTIDVQNICPDILNEEYAHISLLDQTEKDNVVSLKECKASCEDLINTNDEEFFSNESNVEKDINAIKSKTLTDRTVKNALKNTVPPVCSNGFKPKDTLINHMPTDTQKKITCTICSAELSSNSSLGRHLRIHTGEKPYICDICGKDFNQHSTLKKHKQFHFREIKRRERLPKHMLCSYCGLTFTGDGKFKRHLINTPGHIDLESEETRNQILSNVCKVCDCYFDPKYLNQHLAIHAGIKNYLCSYCGKKFTAKAALDNHLRVHTGERPYKCEICNKTFSQRTGVKCHKCFQPDERPFKCEVCCKGFKDKAELKLHSTLHTSENGCTYCGRIFSKIVNLKRHIAIHTKCNGSLKDSNNVKKQPEVHLKEKKVT